MPISIKLLPPKSVSRNYIFNGRIPPEYEWLITEPWQRKTPDLEIRKAMSFAEWRALADAEEAEDATKKPRRVRYKRGAAFQAASRLSSLLKADRQVSLPIRIVKCALSSPKPLLPPRSNRKIHRFFAFSPSNHRLPQRNPSIIRRNSPMRQHPQPLPLHRLHRRLQQVNILKHSSRHPNRRHPKFLTNTSAIM
jgi:hypothetical protein